VPSPTLSPAHYVYQATAFAFSARPDGNPENRLGVYWDANQVDVLYEPAGTAFGWTYHEYEVTATSDTTRLQFVDLAFPDSYGTLLDDVSVMCAIEEETGWDAGDRFDNGWAMYFSVDVPCECVAPEPVCETAWGYGAVTFKEDLGFDKWGWVLTYTVQ